MDDGKIQNLILLAFLIFLLYLIFLACKCLWKSYLKYKERKEEKKDRTQIQFLDQMLRPAEVSLRYVQDNLRYIIESYLYALYNNSISSIPKGVSTALYSTTLEEIERYSKIGIERKLIRYTPEEKFSIRQNNSSIYMVTELIVAAKYEIEVYSEHSTFKRKEFKKVEQTFTFIGTNNQGWILDVIGKEKLIDTKITDL